MYVRGVCIIKVLFSPVNLCFITGVGLSQEHRKVEGKLVFLPTGPPYILIVRFAAFMCRAYTGQGIKQ